eukprot:1378684-Pleurochrysis_carterae.AAC.2
MDTLTCAIGFFEPATVHSHLQGGVLSIFQAALGPYNQQFICDGILMGSGLAPSLHRCQAQAPFTLNAPALLDCSTRGTCFARLRQAPRTFKSEILGQPSPQSCSWAP